ncbi:hypothetical protein UFOVP574_20 [uncultured Caudovirales phage]|uniref:Uncharacterized protein n=1 Tax=uncultured Caudovirales phage TaxID=2100421 RepID=A0A6J5N4Q3_9CAUD|nr:hypothetical protein UFOVP574_20 [uncultured Caudovirales phage]
MNKDIKRAEYLGRLIGATRWCEEDIELCDKNMLVERLKRIAALSNEISTELMEHRKTFMSPEDLALPYMQPIIK